MDKVEIVDGVASLPPDQWNRLVGSGSPFLEWEWLASLEEAGCLGESTGWRPIPLVARERDELVAACPLYLKDHSDGEFVFDWGWAEAADRAGIAYYPKLLVGVPFTPVRGARFLIAPGVDAESWRERLAGALRELCLGNQLSGVHVNFCEPEECDALSEAGFLPRIGFQYHWSNDGYTSFDDYLGRFRSKRRNQIRRERRSLEEQCVTLEVVTGDSISPAHVDAMFDFYRATVHQRAWGRQYLTREFFDLLLERYRHRLVFVIASTNGEPVAGTLNVRKGDSLYGRYWGARLPLRHLHFNVCYYAGIEYCIEEGLRRFEPGAGGDYKQLRGFDAQPTLSCHFLSEPRLSSAVEAFLDRERSQADETIDWLRDRSALKKKTT